MNMMDVVRRAGTFFDFHPKRQLALEKAIDKIEPEAKRTKLGELVSLAATPRRSTDISEDAPISCDMHGEHLSRRRRETGNGLRIP